MSEKTKHTEIDRVCLACGQTFKMTAAGIKAHFKACKGV